MLILCMVVGTGLILLADYSDGIHVKGHYGQWTLAIGVFLGTALFVYYHILSGLINHERGKNL